MVLNKIGMQLYSMPHLLNQDFPGTLKLLAELGYQEVEFAGPYAHSPEQVRQESILAKLFGLQDSGYYSHVPTELRALLDDLGLAAPAAHAALRTLQENLGPVLEAAQIIGHHYIVCEFLKARTLDTYKKSAELFNQIGMRCRAAGVQFAYHNHSFEFGEMAGQIPYDVLLQETDPELVSMELDLFWLKVAGVDPLDYFARYPGRFPIVHLKDMTAEMEVIDRWQAFEDSATIQRIFANLTDVGQGVIDFPKILDQADLAGIEHYIVECDFPKDELGFAQRSIRYLSQLEI